MQTILTNIHDCLYACICMCCWQIANPRRYANMYMLECVLQFSETMRIWQPFMPTIDEQSDYVIFFCGHIYHQRCAPKRNDVSCIHAHHNKPHFVELWTCVIAHAQTLQSAWVGVLQNILVQEVRNKRGGGHIFKMGVFLRGYGITLLGTSCQKQQLLVIIIIVCFSE